MDNSKLRSHYKTGQHVIYSENMSKSYGNKTVLDDIDLAVSEGEFITMVGPSGCGKSTFLRLLLGEEMASAGTLLIGGKEVQTPDPTRGIVYQRYGLFPHLTALEHVLLGFKFQLSVLDYFQRRKELNDKAIEYLKRVRMEDHAAKYPAQLSGGQQQRVAIAQTLIMTPKVLMMDEPYGALDPFTREELQLFILELWEETKMTIFFITHDLEEAVYLGSRVIGLSQYYEDGRRDWKRGARIVADLNLGREIKSPEVKATAEFGRTMRLLRSDCFTPNHLQHVNDFTMQHPNSFMSLSDEQKKR